MPERAAEAAVQASTAVSYTTSAGVIAGGVYTLNEWLAIGGFCIALLTFASSIYFNIRREKIMKGEIK